MSAPNAASPQAPSPAPAPEPLRWLARFEEGIVIVLMAAMTLLAFAQVIARYVFNYSFVWALELTGLMFAWLIFIGMAYGVRVGAHIGVDALVRTLRPVAARRLTLIATALCLAYALIVLWGGTQYVIKMHAVGILMQDMPVQQWIPRLILPLGFGLLALRFGQLLWRLARGENAHLLGDEVHDALRHRVVDDADSAGEPPR